MQALLGLPTPLSQAALAEATGVSARSLCQHLNALAALTLVERTDDRFRLHPPTREERGADIRPAVLNDRAAARQDFLFDVVLALTDDLPTDFLAAVFAGGT